MHGERPPSLRAEMVLPLTGLSTEQEQKRTPITFLHYKSKIVTSANCLVIKYCVTVFPMLIWCL